MPVKVRSRPEGPKDTNTTPPTGNGANLVMAKIDDEVDGHHRCVHRQRV